MKLQGLVNYAGGATRLQILEWIMRGNGIPPTFREMADALGVNINAISAHVVALRKKGLISEGPRQAARTMTAKCRWIPEIEL